MASQGPHTDHSIDRIVLAPLREPEAACLRGDLIISINSDVPLRSLETGRVKRGLRLRPKKRGIWRRKMNPLKFFESDEAKIKDGRYDKFIFQKLEDHPEGYPRLAAFIDSDVDYTMYRGFGILHARSLLYKQAELAELEQELQVLDENDKDTWKLHSHVNFPRGDNEARKSLMEKIDLKMKDYDEQLLRDSQIRKLRKPSRRLHKSFFNYVFNTKPVIAEDEKFIYHRDDFVCLTDHVEFNWLDDVLHKFMDYDQSGLLRRICITKEDRARTTNPFVYYYSRGRLKALMSTLIAFFSTFLLMVPVYLLITVTMDMRLMATLVLGFVFLFAAALSILTRATRLDVFISTATYSAVLMVFLANLQQGLSLVADAK